MWFDELDLRGGESEGDTLEAGLRNSDVLVALLNGDSSSQPNPFFEIGAAIGMGKSVVGIVSKDLDPSAFQMRLRRNLLRDTPEHTADELLIALQAA